MNKKYTLLVDDAFDLSGNEVVAYENLNLENKYNEFRLLMQEYRDDFIANLQMRRFGLRQLKIP